ncbi:hypothetical protein BDV40DRAFT_252991 [Aspergillus tamarii]|uniref:Uncharacterized protein n=1 Tax=Aspergillus tamarii TaxID=41984 RepID=A0A5N6V8Y7_ASPTM|nr:hypothetical protein BDV40DRAFT_252991 [Aspergillus tamarii]
MSPYNHLPAVDPSLLSNKQHASILKDTEVNVTNDYGTPNLLFFYFVPFLPDDRKPDLEALQDEIQSWNAWELGQTEVQVRHRIADKSLPSDDSTASRVKRTNYRAKVIDYLRESSETTWLVKNADSHTGPFSADVNVAEVNGKIRDVLKDFYVQESLPAQFSVILNIITDLIASQPDADNKYLFTYVHYHYDVDQKVFKPDIRQLQFSVTQIAPEEGKDKVKLNISNLNHVYSLLREKWRSVRPDAEEIIEAGEKIRKEMALNLYFS